MNTFKNTHSPIQIIMDLFKLTQEPEVVEPQEPTSNEVVQEENTDSSSTVKKETGSDSECDDSILKEADKLKTLMRDETKYVFEIMRNNHVIGYTRTANKARDIITNMAFKAEEVYSDTHVTHVEEICEGQLMLFGVYKWFLFLRDELLDTFSYRKVTKLFLE